MANGTSTETVVASACAPPGAPPPATPPVLPAPKSSQFNRLIDLWHAMSEDDQAFWRDMFASNKTPDAIREELRQRLDVLFLYDDQLERFKRWEKDYQARAEEVARQRLDERLGLTPLPQSDPAATHNAFLVKAYARAIATGNFDLGFKAVRQHLNVDGAVLDREKFEFKATSAASKAGANASPQSGITRPNKPANPDPASDNSAVEEMPDLRRRLFGALPQQDPQASHATLESPEPASNLTAKAGPVAKPSPVATAPTPPVETPAAVKAGLNQINSSIVLTQAIHEKWRLVKDSFSDWRLRVSAPVNFQTCVDNSAQVKQQATALREQMEPLAAAATGPAAVTWRYTMNYFGHMLAALVMMSGQFQRAKFQDRIPLPGNNVSDAMSAITTGTLILCGAARQARDLLAQRLACLSPPNTS